MPLIQVFIATYNRPSLFVNSIRSALCQIHDSYEVIVSDNSTNDDTEILISKIKDNRLSYIRRKPSLPVIDHLNAIFEYVTSDYFMIFHDDDLMHGNMIKVLYDTLINNKDVIAVGSNARMVNNGKIVKRPFNKRLKKDIRINNMAEMIVSYSLPAFVQFQVTCIKMKLHKDCDLILSKVANIVMWPL